jgi:hypothetical protein
MDMNMSPLPCRLCKLSPEVERILDENEVHFMIALADAPVRTLCIIARVEGGLSLVGVGGKEGVYPRAEEDAVLRFAREVSVGFARDKD